MLSLRDPVKIGQSLLARFVLEDLWASKKRRSKGFKLRFP